MPNKEAHAKWEAKYAHIMAWIIGYVGPNIDLNLRPFATAAKVWECLEKI